MQRFSKKRQAILDCLRSTDSHPTAEWIYRTLKPSYPDLSLATVYRNLGEFEEAGQIISVGVVDGQKRYDGNILPHAHATCSLCGTIYDLHSLPDTARMIAAVTKETGIKVTETSLSFRGVCADCRDHESRKETDL